MKTVAAISKEAIENKREYQIKYQAYRRMYLSEEVNNIFKKSYIKNKSRYHEMMRSYVRFRKKLCPLCGTNQMKHSSVSCKACSGKIKSMEYFGSKFAVILRKLNISLLGEYESSHIRHKFKCNACDTVFVSLPYYLADHIGLCPKCYPKNQSKGETEVFNFVKKCMHRVRNSHAQ